MAFPPSVHHLHLPRTKRHHRAFQEGSQEDELDPTQPSQSQLRKGKGKNSVYKDDQRGGITDDVGVGGAVGGFGKQAGVRLDRDKRGGWGWNWSLEDPKGGTKEGRWSTGKAATYFPGTISTETEGMGMPFEDVLQSSVQYAESLCLPYERDGLRDVITEILTEDFPSAGPSGTSKQPGWPHLDLDLNPEMNKKRDVYRGARVVVVQNPKGRPARSFVAFPTGKVGHQLRDATALIVRLQTTTHLLNIHPLSSTPSPFSSTRTAQLSYVDTESRKHINIALDAEIWSRALVVDEGGGVWLWWEEKETKGGRLEKVMKLRKVREAVEEEEEEGERFWGVAFGTRPGTAIVVSAREATIIDIDDPDHPTRSLMTLNGPTRRFLGIERTAAARGSKWTVMCTTHEVFWIDETGKGVPSLGWKHGYEGADGMEIIVLPGVNKGECTTLLYSASDSFITVFTTPKSGPLRFIGQPYALSLNLPPESIPTTLTSLSISPNRHLSSLLGLSDDGTLSYIPLSATTPLPPSAEKQKPLEPIPTSWDDTVSELAKKDDRNEFGAGDGWEEKAKVGFRELNLRWAWLAIGKDDDGSDSGENSEAEGLDFAQADIEEEDEDADVQMMSDGEEGQWDDDESEVAEERWFVPELFERYLRETEAPVESVMTVAELARDSLVPFSEPERAENGQEKEKEGKVSKILPIPLHPSSIRPTLEALGKIDFSKHLTSLLDLQSFLPALASAQPPLSKDDIDPVTLYDSLCEAFPPQSARDKHATAQLVLSLFLFSKVISPEDFLPIPKSAHDQALEDEQAEVQRRDEVEQFVQAASRLTLDESGPGRIQFNVLQPRLTLRGEDAGNGEEEWADEEGEEAERAAVEADLQSRSAKALMEGWKVGEDPATWVWEDWNLDQSHTTPFPRATQSSTSQRAPPLPTIQTARPIRPLPSSRTLSNLALPSPNTPEPHQFSHLVPPTLSTSHSLPSLSRMPAQARSSPPPGWDGGGSQELSGAGQIQSQSQSQGAEWASTQVERGKFGGKLEKKKKSKKRLGGF
ncbi:hypothetical protein L198_07695 [Cryptococcus wingfieldii CBS 7118]|uniref:RRN6 beta-propeller domain-containing protein n=1 Tax=Cryptococcus wingfieldii CBS 7118 TaxID=1295528 RepID=A0A1E3I5B7_9TREE|nr:hypothetical protein L198_07695 [Cryptococcus wingfieldii CBS 7118]ODN83799.1 hypothetical protein L198_07695 [Cryptococcus wingfieldii CBS 7118]